MYLRLATTLAAAGICACSSSDGRMDVNPDWKRVPVLIEVRLAEGAAGPGLIEAAAGQGKTVYLHPDAVLANRDIARVEAIKTRIGQGLILQVWTTKAGGSRLRQVTGAHVGDSLAILIDSAVVAVPIIRQAIGGNPKLPLDMGVPLGPKEAQQLATAIAKTWPPAQRRAPARR